MRYEIAMYVSCICYFDISTVDSELLLAILCHDMGRVAVRCCGCTVLAKQQVLVLWFCGGRCCLRIGSPYDICQKLRSLTPCALFSRSHATNSSYGLVRQCTFQVIPNFLASFNYLLSA